MPATVEPADRPGSWVVRLDGMEQSHVDLDEPTRLVFDYVRRTADLLDSAVPAGEPLRVLHVGGAGMTLARYVAATRPGSRQVVLEPDAALVDLVRAELPLPSGGRTSVRPVDGRAGLGVIREGWAQAVVVDAFRDAVVPSELVTAEAWAELDRVVAPDGLVVLNLVDRTPFTHTRDVVAGMREVFDPRGTPLAVGVETATWRGRRPGNLLLVAGARAPRGSEASYRWLQGSAVASSLGGGSSLQDPVAET